MAAKKELRQRLRGVLASLSRAEIDARSRQACHRLVEQPEYLRAEVVMVFLSLTTEVDTTALVLRCWQDHKRVLAPKVSWEQRRMMPIEITSLTHSLQETEYGIREPVSGVPFPISLIDVVIVPALGYDEFGNRLGRGSGFYDRFLGHADFRGVACGIAFEVQVMPQLPVGPLDRAVNLLVTDAQVRRFSESTRRQQKTDHHRGTEA